MTATVMIPTALRAYTDATDTVELGGTTVGEVLGNLTRRYGALRRHLYDDSGRLRGYVNVYVNDEDFRFLQGEDTPVASGDCISIVPAIAGGRS